MTGSGTQADPYILTTWEELLNASGYCEWHGGNLNFNDIQPSGFTSLVSIGGIIDFKGATFINFKSKNTSTQNPGGIIFTSSISNLNFLKSKFENVRSPLIQVARTPNSGTATSCAFEGEVTTTHNVDIIGSAYNSSYYHRSNYQKCAFRFRANTTAQIWFATGTAGFIDCDIYTDIIQNGAEFSNIYRGGTGEYNSRFSNCRLRGRFINSGGDYVKVGDTNSRHGFNFFDFDSGTYLLLSSSSKSVYNSEKITAYEGTTNVVGCTAEQLASVSYLRSSNVGWDINENATPSQTLSFDVDDLHNATSKRIETMSMDYTGIIQMRVVIKGYTSSDWYWFRFSGRDINGNEIYNSGWKSTGTTIQIPFNDNVATWVLQSGYAMLSYGSLSFYDVIPEDLAPISCTIAWGRWSIDENGELYNIYAVVIPRSGAFKNSHIDRVHIPKTVKAIGDESFAGTTLRHAKIAADCTYKPASFPTDCVVIQYPDDRYVQLRDGAGRALLDGDARRLYVLKEENNG